MEGPAHCGSGVSTIMGCEPLPILTRRLGMFWRIRWRWVWWRVGRAIHFSVARSFERDSPWKGTQIAKDGAGLRDLSGYAGTTSEIQEGFAPDLRRASGIGAGFRGRPTTRSRYPN